MKLASSNTMSVVTATGRSGELVFTAISSKPRLVRSATKCGEHQFTATQSGGKCAAFTLVEIAICLAVVAFALVAIIGVLPRGLNAQRDNRTETIINQDAQVWMETLKDSFRGADQLMNHVELIVVNDVTNWNVTFFGPGPDRFATAEEIVGLLTTPLSTRIFADVIAISGPAVEKVPDVADVAFKYRMRVEMTPSRYISRTNAPGDNFNHLRNHLYDMRLVFRWPLVGASPGNREQTYRMQTEGVLDSPDGRLWFFKK